MLNKNFNTLLTGLFLFLVLMLIGVTPTFGQQIHKQTIHNLADFSAPVTDEALVKELSRKAVEMHENNTAQTNLGGLIVVQEGDGFLSSNRKRIDYVLDSKVPVGTVLVSQILVPQRAMVPLAAFNVNSEIFNGSFINLWDGSLGPLGSDPGFVIFQVIIRFPDGSVDLQESKISTFFQDFLPHFLGSPIQRQQFLLLPITRVNQGTLKVAIGSFVIPDEAVGLQTNNNNDFLLVVDLDKAKFFPGAGFRYVTVRQGNLSDTNIFRFSGFTTQLPN